MLVCVKKTDQRTNRLIDQQFRSSVYSVALCEINLWLCGGFLNNKKSLCPL